MPLKLSRMTEDDIHAFAVVDAAAAEGWPLAQAMDQAANGGEPRQRMIERWTRADWRNDEEVAWLKVTDSDLSDELIAAALWRFHPGEENQAEAGAAAITSTPVVEVTAAEGGGKEESNAKEEFPAVFDAMRAIGEKFRREFIGGKAHACTLSFYLRG
ncbi:hypothetical protein BAUCODRAFT_21141 [Baudoinia panamericana UAMH 10762]|uniref:Uncharacterized protein n=1 Tax=Baudoinia panamericana (strain UAMH 10762) TaxID=717646 RepID=M2NNU7_BAUPA|nr:uncharacterized protein BAUCODRAFT_21141 [Baudoinia panamericana UAMH 10762]EMD01210.1 hypothetical protein BAUCODRAFT_21141 [Baudoinia panamericana UAMH 10762]